ncbi:MAG: TonB-dependent receptor [Pseudomonadota bacterium]
MAIAQSFKSIFKSSLLGLSALAAATPALAQGEASGDDAILEDIMVTARRQSESLQDVPITVSVLGGKLLDNFQLNEVADLQSRIPTLNVQVGGSGSGGQLSLRGIGSSNISAAFDSAIAFNFDGVVVNTMRFVQAGFFDTQQVEVLKGPQSLFFGKSASGGVLSIQSKNPTDELEIIARGSYEFEEQGYLLEAIASGPITDTLGIRLGVQFNDIDEFARIQDNIPAVNRERGLQTLLVRGTLDWKPNENFTANLKANYFRLKNDGAIGNSENLCGPDGVADPVILLQGAVSVPGGYDCDAFDQRYPTADPSPTIVGQIPSQDPLSERDFNGVPFGETEIFNIRLKLDYDITDSLTLTSITGYVDVDALEFDCFSYGGVGPAFIAGAPDAPAAPALAAVNTPGSAQAFGCSSPNNTLEQFSQEVRLTSNFEGPFNFMIGAFYEDRNILFGGHQQAVNISIIAPDPVTGNTVDWYRTQVTDAEALSFFVSGTYEITDRLTLSGGVRWTDEQKTSVIDVPFVHAFLSSGPAFIDSGFNSGDIEFSDSQWTPEVALTYALTDTINVFASFKTGFKSGGIDNSALPSSSLLGLDDPATREAVEDSIRFRSETAIGGEVGIKALAAGGALRVNATGFYYVFDDLQIQNFNGAAVQFETDNAGEVTTLGVEVDWNWSTPVDGLTLSGAAAVTSSEFSDVFIVRVDDLDGRRVGRAPVFSGNVAADWSTPITSALELGMNGNLSYTGSYFTDQVTLNDNEQDAFVTLDTAISISNPEQGWKVSLVATNLTDKIWINTTSDRPFRDNDDLISTQNRGRQVFLEARFDY